MTTPTKARTNLSVGDNTNRGDNYISESDNINQSENFFFKENATSQPAVIDEISTFIFENALIDLRNAGVNVLFISYLAKIYSFAIIPVYHIFCPLTTTEWDDT